MSIRPVALVEEKRLEVWVTVQPEGAFVIRPGNGAHACGCLDFVDQVVEGVKESDGDIVELWVLGRPQCHAIEPASTVSRWSALQDLL